MPKRYGQSRIDKCPFCDKQATVMSKQDVPVCLSHKEDRLNDLKCVCGSSLEILHGKFGVFFSCIKCGNMNLRKVLEFNTVKPKMKNLRESLLLLAAAGMQMMVLRQKDLESVNVLSIF